MFLFFLEFDAEDGLTMLGEYVNQARAIRHGTKLLVK